MYDAKDFLLVAGTAAPIIALANVVVFGDSYKLLRVFGVVRKRPTITLECKDWANRGYKAARVAVGMSYINFLAQALVLVYVLFYLSEGPFGGAGLIPILCEGYGIGILGVATLFSSQARCAEYEVGLKYPDPLKKPDRTNSGQTIDPSTPPTDSAAPRKSG
jgi:hypothetical protein